MSQPITKELCVSVVRTELLAMRFDVPVIDENGNVIGTQKTSPSGEGLNQLASAIGGSFYKLLKENAIVDVTTTGGPGTGLIR
jgi:hypothetical protein